MTRDAIDGLRADYDATPYTSDAFAQSAPGNLAAIAHVFGLDAPTVATARILEIGCAAAGNLIPFAATHPEARAVGIDLSRVQIDLGRARVDALGLRNVELIAGDVAAIDVAALGRFDFVVAHGVYSWVPETVRDAILALVRAVLAPNGVAYLSYNTYPGWKAKEVVRDAMLLAGGASGTPGEKVDAARDVVGFLRDVAPADGVLARTLAEFVARDEDFGDSYLLHDELETFNAPCYFYEFVGRAGGHGLAFLAEARPETMFPSNHGPRVAEYLTQKCGGSQVLVEQYLDFVVNRAFRESLLVHADRAPRIRYALDHGRFGALHVAAWSPPVDGGHRAGSLPPGVRGRRRRNAVHERPGAQGGARDAERAVAVDDLSRRAGAGGAGPADRRGLHAWRGPRRTRRRPAGRADRAGPRPLPAGARSAARWPGAAPTGGDPADGRGDA